MTNMVLIRNSITGEAEKSKSLPNNIVERRTIRIFTTLFACSIVPNR